MSTPPAPPPLPPAGPPSFPLDNAAVQWIKDGEHLRLLSIFHYVVGGLAILFSCFFIFYIVFGFMMLTSFRNLGPPPPPRSPDAVGSPAPAATPTAGTPDVPSSSPAAPGPSPGLPRGHGTAEPPAFVGYFMIGVGTFAVLLGCTVGALLIVSGRNIARRTGRTFSMVIAGLSCLQVPLGTLLGVFTFVVLSRPSVMALYAADHRKS